MKSFKTFNPINTCVIVKSTLYPFLLNNINSDLSKFSEICQNIVDST